MIIFAPVNATIAQSVEHFIRNEKVASSSLACGSPDKNAFVTVLQRRFLFPFRRSSLPRAACFRGDKGPLRQ